MDTEHTPPTAPTGEPIIWAWRDMKGLPTVALIPLGNGSAAIVRWCDDHFLPTGILDRLDLTCQDDIMVAWIARVMTWTLEGMGFTQERHHGR